MSNKEHKIKGTYTFSDIDYKTLKNIINIELVKDRTIFKEWFDFKHKITDADVIFFNKLIKANEYNIADYFEYQLLGYFVTPFLNRVYFYGDNFREWYQPIFEGIVNGYKLTGKPDFMVASGIREPKEPYFFIQEFKRSIPKSKPPLEQLLAEMAVALEINKKKIVRGAYNIGQHWKFVILEKIKEGKYQYYESESFNCLKINELKQIYINLQAIKHKYCK